MCSLTLECVLSLSTHTHTFKSWTRARSVAPRARIWMRIAAGYRMCSLTLECVLSLSLHTHLQVLDAGAISRAAGTHLDADCRRLLLGSEALSVLHLRCAFRCA